MSLPETKPEQNSPEFEEKAGLWLESIKKESMLPVAGEEVIRDSLITAQDHSVPMKFIMTLCPVFRNIEGTQAAEGQPTREIVPFDENQLPRLTEFAKEIASLVVGTTNLLGTRPQILLVVNDIFEPGVEKRLLNPQEGPALLAEAKKVLHRLFQQVDTANPEIWPCKFQSAIKIVLQSNLVKPLSRLGLPRHSELVSMVMQEGLDPSTAAFARWLAFLRDTRQDSLMSPNAWLTSAGAKTIHERVRFLMAMYWIDGLIDPLLFKTIFEPNPQKKRQESQISPVFICGVTRKLQAESEMAGVNFHLQESRINGIPAVKERGLVRPRGAIHVIRNTATWTEPTLPVFTFNGRVRLK